MLQPTEIQRYLRKVLGADTVLVNVKALGEEEHDTGISNLLSLEVQVGSQTKQLILRRPASTVYNTEQLSDRAYTVLQAYHLYNHIPHHPRSLDVGIIQADGTLNSIQGDAEFVLLQEFGQGELYFHSLMQTLKAAEPSKLEERRAVALAEYLLKLHAETHDDDNIYQRSLRDIVAGGVGAMSIIGGYTKELREAYHDELNDVLCGFISLAWNLDRYPANRLCRIHGDFHPLNILFREDTELTLIDASGIGWGDAAFDVGILFMNY
jgi:aminoglycoside phosphotransferase (APT) family kinase protein